MTEPPAPSGSGGVYSRAFDNLVEDSDDVVGLLAYALFKQGIREEAERGQKSAGDTRNPPPAVVATYRAASERRINLLITDNLELSRAEMQNSAALTAIQTAEVNLKQHVNDRTAFGSALWPNLVAWGITILLTGAILYLAGKPEPAQVLRERIDQATGEQPETTREREAK